jgi:serine/threonine protein kinase
MSYCPECGSEVASVDTFCAYCGISLQVPVAAEPPPQEVETVVEEPIVDSAENHEPTLGEPQLIKTSAFLEREGGETDGVHLIPAPTLLQELATQESSETPVSQTPVFEPAVIAEEVLPTSVSRAEEEIDFDLTIPYTPKPKIEPAPELSETLLSQTAVEPDPVDQPVEASEESHVVELPAETVEPSEIAPEISNTLLPEPEFVKSEPAAEHIEAESVEPVPVLISEPAVESLETESVKPEAEPEESKPDVELAVPESTPAAAIESPIPIDAIEPDVVESVTPNEVVEANPVVTEAEVPVLTPAIAQSVPAIAAEVHEAKEPVLLPVETESESPFVVFKSQSLENQSGDSEKEGRSFTNPNMGVGDTDGRNKTKLKPLDEGTVLNSRYEIVRKIGGGGMGAVYLATDRNLGGVMRAVKEMVQSYIEEEQQEKAVQDFKRESLLLTSLEHPAIPTIFDYFFDETEGRFYLVMKYISGGDLAARLRSAPEGRIDEVSITDWAIQIADVLDYLHRREPPIVYRDLKPSNIMIDGNTGRVMIIDFGIARWVNKEEKGVTAVGTMGYAPPELFSGNVEPRSDIYSLGSTMFHLLTGADPQSNPLLIFDFNKHPRPRQINSQLSDQMEQILMRAVEYNSGQRFASAAEMKEELQKHLENLRKGTVTFGVVNSGIGSPAASLSSVFCGFCGQKIVSSDMFCPFCGAQQPIADQSKKLGSAPLYAPAVIKPRLLVIGTNDLDRIEYVLEKDSNLLGRRDPMSNIFPEVDLSKYDPQTKISRKHARIWREGDAFMLEDLGSSNGTILISGNNDQIRLLPRQPQILANGDTLRLGDTVMKFTIA